LARWYEVDDESSRRHVVSRGRPRGQQRAHARGIDEKATVDGGEQGKHATAHTIHRLKHHLSSSFSHDFAEQLDQRP
jgi:hypothetical protein